MGTRLTFRVFPLQLHKIRVYPKMFKQIRDGDDKVEPLTKVQSLIDKHYTKLQRQRYVNSQFSDLKIYCFYFEIQCTPLGRYNE